MASQKIIVCYLRAGSELLQDHWLNRMARYFAPRYDTSDGTEPVVHVELYFPSAHGANGMSSGIHYGGTTFLHPKMFRRSNWVFHAIPATAEQVRAAKAFCSRQSGTPFNYRGFFLPAFLNISHTPRMNGLDTKRMPWYCSELVAYALHYAQLLDTAGTVEARAHPNAAYNVIQKHCDTYIDCARSLNGRRLEL